MKKLLMLIVAVMTAWGCYAQKWVDNAPGKYLKSSATQISAAATPCNQGEEPFNVFIAKFRTNSQFRNSRISLTEISEGQQLSDITDWSVLKAFTRKEVDGMAEYGVWYNISADEVCFENAYYDPEYGGAGEAIYFRFNRQDGLWRLTGLAVTAR